MNQHPKLYPLVMRPAYQHYIWGGDRIPKIFNRDLPAGVYAESWEVSDRPEGLSTVADGALAGWTLDRVLREYGPALTGGRTPGAKFPLLIKLIDARQNLSVQVHPDDESAPAVGGEPKTEAWYVLAGAPDAAVYAGFKPGVDAAAFRHALQAGGVDQLLKKIPVTPGDLIYIPGGLAHAIGAGCLLLEVQQNSNTTYRVYDWGRLGADGHPRALHVEQALRVMDWAAQPRVIRAAPHAPAGTPQKLLITPYFTISRLTLTSDANPVMMSSGCQALFVAAGTVVLEVVGGARRELPAGASVVIPADAASCRLRAGTPCAIVAVGLVRL